MKVLIAVKRVVDPEVRVKVRPDGSGVDTANVKMAMNPFDEVAVEEAVRLKEQGIATELVAVSCGPKECQETLRTALAVGVDRVILVETDAELQPLAVAKALRAVIEREEPQLVICGKQSIDGDSSQTGPMLAGLLGWPQATAASGLEISGGRATVRREVDDGSETVEAALPLVITADLTLNVPRYPKLPNVLKAKQKPIEILQPEELAADIAPRLTTMRVVEAPRRQGGVMVADVNELVAKLRDDAKVIE